MKPFGKIGTAGCELSPQERERYTRQIALSADGEAVQLMLKESSALVIGAGGLGSVVLPYLVGAGVGCIGIVENDVVSLSNLHRQTLYNTSQIGLWKALCAKERLEKLNPEACINIHNTRFTPENALTILTPYDLIIDCTDNIVSRYTIDDASIKTGKPFIYGSLCEYTGQLSVFNHEGAPSYSDIYPYSPSAEKFTQPPGVFGALAGIVGSMQAMEAIRLLTGQQTLAGYLLLVDIQNYGFRKIKIG